MAVPQGKQQHDIMRQAVENHSIEVLIIDEIGNKKECKQAQSISGRGIKLCASVHGVTLDDLVFNDELSDLVGGVGSLFLSAKEAEDRQVVKKTIQERKTQPAFDVAIEVTSHNQVVVYRKLANAVDSILLNQPVEDIEYRSLELNENGQFRRIVKKEKKNE